MKTRAVPRRPAGSPSGGQFAPVSQAESELDLPNPEPEDHASSHESPLPDFATCNQISTARWNAVRLAAQEANQLTMGSLAGLIADHHPDAAGVRLETTWDDDGSVYVCAARLVRADGSEIEVTDELCDELASHGADLNLHDLRRRYLDEDHPRSRHQPTEPSVGTWHGEEDGATIDVAKLTAVSPIAARSESERNAATRAAWDQSNSLMKSANIASLAAAAAWLSEKHPNVAEVEIDILYDDDGTHCYSSPSMFAADGTEIGFDDDLDAEDAVVQRFTDIELDDLIARFLTQDRGPGRTPREPSEVSVGRWANETVTVDVAKLRAAAAARLND